MTETKSKTNATHAMQWESCESPGCHSYAVGNTPHCLAHGAIDYMRSEKTRILVEIFNPDGTTRSAYIIDQEELTAFSAY